MYELFLHYHNKNDFGFGQFVKLRTEIVFSPLNLVLVLLRLQRSIFPCWGLLLLLLSLLLSLLHHFLLSFFLFLDDLLLFRLLLLQVFLLVAGPGHRSQLVVHVDVGVPGLGESGLVQSSVLDDGGVAVLLVLDQVLGVDWLPPAVAEAAMERPGLESRIFGSIPALPL